MELKSLKTILASVAVGATMAGAAMAEDLRIAYTGYSTDNTFWIGVAKAAAAKADKMGVELLDLTASSPDAAAQKDAVDRAINMGVDGIIIGSVDNRAFGTSLDMAKRKGIPVVAVDTGIHHDHIASLVQTDNLAAAGIAGKYIVDQIDGGTVLILGGSAGHQTGNARRDGVKNAAEAAGHEVIFQICDWKDACAYETTINFLQSNPDITAIFSAWDPGALAAVSAASELGKLDDLVIVGFDGNPANLVSIEAGELAATIKQDNARMGAEAVQNLVGLIKGDEVPEFTPIDGILITSENVADYK
ncbi:MULTISPECIES: sugar ABC transporter substrate-binding protein [unclassified Mameliella]|uniref:sugar ABC transporter substrate-binding protein n=1 Tax=unclassified Mameliella TaxID=2630630 RepID=UPI00273E4663|nr:MULTISPECIES: sugar ABC transporter substrate-binding protein [unclassified Mameliella]